MSGVADVAVVEAHHVQPARCQLSAEVLVPGDHLGAEAHHEQRGLLERILAGLKVLGKDLDSLTHDDIAPADEFHSQGRTATRALKTGDIVIEMIPDADHTFSQLAPRRQERRGNGRSRSRRRRTRGAAAGRNDQDAGEPARMHRLYASAKSAQRADHARRRKSKATETALPRWPLALRGRPSRSGSESMALRHCETDARQPGAPPRAPRLH